MIKVRSGSAATFAGGDGAGDEVGEANGFGNVAGVGGATQELAGDVGA